MFGVKLSCDVWLVILGTLVAVLLRSITTLHPYSGEAAPPMYGDYEAQRHWMEVTVNLPVDQWYKNGSDNNLLYWGLDYPPLTAYHMYLCGKVAGFLNENYTKLHDSRGYESDEHKLFMRSTVLITDILIYIPAIIIFHWTCVKEHNNKTNAKSQKQNQKIQDRILSPSLSTILALLYPGIILIDHGHFQYNSISLGLLIYSIIFILHKKDIWASVFFCLSLNYKQMELYHAFPFFVYLLSSCVPKPGQHAVSGLIKLIKIGLAVMITFTVIWFPFIFNLEDLHSVVHRLFPIDRGVFEDKVSNFWCVFNIFYKIKLKFTNHEMMRYCLFATIFAIFPSSFDLFLRPSRKKFVLSLINSSLAFFLFSFQVHEKSILIVAIPVLLYFPHQPFISFWFLCLTVFSMLPLLIKDGLLLATVALTWFSATSFRICIEHFYRNSLNLSDGLGEYYRSLLHVLLDVEYKKATQLDIVKLTYRQLVKNQEVLRNFLFHVIMVASLIGCVIISSVCVIFDPPETLPDLWTVVMAVYSAVHFGGFFLYFNVKQFRIPQEFDDIKNVRVKED